MNKVQKMIFLLSIVSNIHVFCFAQEPKVDSDIKGYVVQEFEHKDLKKWKAYGLGSMEKNHEQTVMHETLGSLGYMLVSPDIYGENVILSYDVMALNPATVLVIEMGAHNSDNFDLNIVDDYDGNIKYLFKNINMYFFAFHNAAHNKKGPFVRKYPQPGAEPLVSAKKNIFEVGKYHHVEIGLEKGKIWFTVDGEKIFKVKDEDYYEGGKIILRIRGTGHELASCLIRNLSVYSK